MDTPWDENPSFDPNRLPSVRNLAVHAPLVLMDCIFPLVSVQHIPELEIEILTETGSSLHQLLALIPKMPLFEDLKSFHLSIGGHQVYDLDHETRRQINLGPAVVWDAFRIVPGCSGMEDFSFSHSFDDGTTLGDNCIRSMANAWPKLRSIRLWWQNDEHHVTTRGCSFASFIYLTEHCPLLGNVAISTIHVPEPEHNPTLPTLPMRPHRLALTVRDLEILDMNYLATFLACTWCSVYAHAQGVPARDLLDNAIAKMRLIRRSQAAHQNTQHVVWEEQDRVIL